MRAGGWWRRVAAVVACLLATTTVAGCRSGSSDSRSMTPPPAGAVVVTSFNFSESTLLAEIYAQALEHAGVPVRRELELGPRELVAPALRQGLVDVVPEYLGTALAAYAPGARVDPADPAAVRRRLGYALARFRVQVLRPAGAQNQNGLVVTRATADRLRLRRISDLAPVAARLTLGGPAECPTRPYCLPGLARAYGLRFARFLPFDTETQRATAVDEHVVDVVVMFTTDGRIPGRKLVLLVDDRHLQPAENVVPVVSARAVERYGARLTTALDAVSARLTQQGLVFLTWRVGVAEKDIAPEARGWLIRQGLLPRPG